MPDRDAPRTDRPESRGGFVEIDYSGDVGIEAWGESQAELIANATRALLGLMCFSPVRSVVARPIEVRAAGAADLLVDWLSAVILSAATRGEVYGEVAVEAADERSAKGVLHGEPLDPSRHELRFDVKGVTYHDLRCEQTGSRHFARVILDL